MGDIDKEIFCSNPACRFHDHWVPVGSKYLNYFDPNENGETVRLSEPAETVNVVTISRNHIYKNGWSIGEFCTDCARELLCLPKKPRAFREIKKESDLRLREIFEQVIGRGKTYTERDFEMFKLGWAFYENKEVRND